VFLGRNGILGRLLDDFEASHVELIAARDARRALVRAHVARDNQRRLQGHALGGFEDLFGDVALEDDGLDEARPVPDTEKLQFAFAGLELEPTLEGDLLAGVAGDVFNTDDGCHERSLDGGWLRRL